MQNCRAYCATTPRNPRELVPVCTFIEWAHIDTKNMSYLNGDPVSCGIIIVPSDY